MLRWKSFCFRLAAVILATILALLLCEGGYSLWTGEPLLRQLLGPMTLSHLRMQEDERVAAGQLTAGPYAVPVDPHVGLQRKGKHRATYNGVPSNTDARGLRIRIGPPPAAGARRVLILGDSVAFGFGVKDDETLAHYLEAVLAEAGGENTPCPVVRTVACPGWSFLNAKRFLLDHLEELAPDIVIFIPIGNDLDDSFAVLETGHRYVDLDPALGATVPYCSTQLHIELAVGLVRSRILLRQGGGMLSFYALTSGVTPESRRRYGEMLDGLEEIDARLRRTGGHFAVAFMSADPFNHRLLADMARRDSKLVHTGLFAFLSEADRLAGDPHFNPHTNKEGALRLARFLRKEKWIEGGKVFPSGAPHFRTNHFRLTREKSIEITDKWDRDLRKTIGPTIDLTDGTGYHQIYGGIQADGMVGRGFFLVLHRPGATRLELSIEYLVRRRGLYPLDLDFTINKQPLGRRQLAGAGTPRNIETLTLDLPAVLQKADYLEVTVRASNWQAVIQKDGVSRLASFKLRTITARP